ncbi:MAG: methyltransferase [Blastomonas sp.]
MSLDFRKTVIAIASGLSLTALSVPAIAKPSAEILSAVADEGRPEDERKLDESRKPAQLLDFLGLKPGDQVLDIFASDGYFTEIIAAAVGPDGASIGWNLPSFNAREPSMVVWRELMRRHGNALLLLQTADKIDVGTDRYDMVLMHLVYHDLYWESERFGIPRMEPSEILAKLYAATKPGGVVGVIDHVAVAGGDPRADADATHRIDPAVILADFKAAGFVLEAESDMYRTPADDHVKTVFDPAVRGKTDRVVYRFRKPSA